MRTTNTLSCKQKFFLCTFLVPETPTDFDRVWDRSRRTIEILKTLLYWGDRVKEVVVLLLSRGQNVQTTLLTFIWRNM